MRLWIYVGLIVLSIGGIAIMDFRAGYGVWYWLIMTAVFGVASLSLSWKPAAEAGHTVQHLMRQEGLHWLTALAAVGLVFLMQWSLQLEPKLAALMALLVLAMACVLAGIHFQWRLAVVGAVLAATFVAAVLAADFFWVGLLIAVIGGVALLVMSRRRQAATAAD
jgi:hypothetical protein